MKTYAVHSFFCAYAQIRLEYQEVRNRLASLLLVKIFGITGGQ